MNSIRNTDKNDRRSCNSFLLFDPELNPATAAVNRLNFFPEWDFERVRLLSERDENFGSTVDENGDPCIYDVQIVEYEKLAKGAFDMTSLSRISEAISREHGRSTRKYPVVPLAQSPTDIRNLDSTLNTRTKDHTADNATKKKRPLVSCIACRSRLSQLDSSPSVTVHDRCCPSTSRSTSTRRFAE